MLYEVHWNRPRDGTPLNPSRFVTWDGKVVDATSAVQWAVGQSYSAVHSRLVNVYAAKVVLVPGSHAVRSVRGRP